MELGEFRGYSAFPFVDRAGCRRQDDEEGIEVWEQRPRGHQPNLLLHAAARARIRSTYERSAGMEVSGLVDERIRSKIPASFAAFGRRAVVAFGARLGSSVHEFALFHPTSQS